MEPNNYLINCLALIAVLLVLVLGDEREEEGSESELHAYNRYAVAEKITQEMNNHNNRA